MLKVGLRDLMQSRMLAIFVCLLIYGGSLQTRGWTSIPAYKFSAGLAPVAAPESSICSTANEASQNDVIRKSPTLALHNPASRSLGEFSRTFLGM